MEKQDFDTSRELKRLFNEHFDRWTKKTRYSLEDLAERCGVSVSYLNHVRRYGRIPGKPILYLIALNLEAENPQAFLNAANVKNLWPYDPHTYLQPSEQTNAGFVSLKIDMQGLASSIRDIIRAELKPKTLNEITKGKPIRFGYNTSQLWLFDEQTENTSTLPTGLFVDIFKIITNALGEPVSFSVIDFRSVKQLFAEDKLDVYGPLFKTKNRSIETICTEPFCQARMTALWRKNSNKYLENLPSPASWEDLKNSQYKIALLRNSLAHDFATTRLLRNEDTLIFCDSIDEIIERLTLSTVMKPAHLSLADAGSILSDFDLAPPLYDILFTDSPEPPAFYEDALAVRPDWPELATALNQILRDQNIQEAIKSLLSNRLDPRLKNLIRV